ncbi:MAG: NIPSNAP family protein [SAR202 cluster bacterium]|nr:NIPSNAP family protein [Chloroflexota bacterium]MQG50408.1 NIPSNAP family protein [SAR202 cluster bacterium]|tara:strand:- start:6194 stop:6517 length:324 start_codon:yes stop_codon:yes gene_type:complete
MIHELRIYEAIPGKLPELNKRFDTITLGYFEKYDMKVVGFWTDEFGDNTKLTYILEFNDLNHRQESWAKFRADEDRAKAFAETEKNGPLVARVTNSILTPTYYSPLR